MRLPIPDGGASFRRRPARKDYLCHAGQSRRCCTLLPSSAGRRRRPRRWGAGGGTGPREPADHVLPGAVLRTRAGAPHRRSFGAVGSGRRRSDREDRTGRA
ncbi:protein of unknown function [Azospirillum baldaniorum]|uniref:Uncharacterized protein n=1 Tax=Azospirillum baldaniorum TaxID=1064539 RepID=A0A9P1JQD3_9PROT|nr:protein of unknown function [Azospirillum baldaniorum]